LGLWQRIKKAAEGAWRPGPYSLSDGGWLPAGTAINFWQKGENVRYGNWRSAMVEACVSAYSQTVAMCPGDHWRKLPNGGRERVASSPLARIIRAPNEYQTISDFLMNAVRELYQTGNVYAYAVRNGRFEIEELHLMQSMYCSASIGENGAIFYNLGGNQVCDRRFGALSMIPARDVWHVRLHTTRDVLKGESPVLAAALDVAASNAALEQQLAFLLNQAKPSVMLATDKDYTPEQVQALSARFDEKTRGSNAGGTPILTGGLKPITVTTTAVDAQIAELMKMSEQNIALCFRMPLQVLGIGGTPYASTELLMQSWIASGLGFALNHIEEAFGKLFRLGGFPDEYVEFSTTALLRSSFKERIEGLSKATISGVYSPDEARNELDLPTVPGGHGKEPRVQQQVVPLSAWGQAPQVAPAAPATPPAPPDGSDGNDPGADQPVDLSAAAVALRDGLRDLRRAG
jgi:HK97 family phage portal protein